MWIGISGLFVLASGCAKPPQVLEPQVIRFIDVESKELFGPDEVSRVQVVQDWTFDSGTIPHDCLLSAGTIQQAAIPGTRIIPSKGEVRVRCRGNLLADQVELVSARIEGLQRGKASLVWRSGSEFDVRTSRLDLDRWSRAGETRDELLFEVGSRDDWSGEISEIELLLTPAVGDLIEFRSLSAERREIRAETLEGLLARPWKVEIDHEWRNALVAVPSSSHQRTLTVPASGSLQLAIGLMSGVTSRVRFLAEVLAEGDPQVILDRWLDGSLPGSGGQWHDVSIELHPWEGRKVTIRLSIESEDRLDPRVGLPVWGNPEVRGISPANQLPNIALIVIDTLRAQNLSLYGYSRGTSPNLEKLAKSRGVVFTSVVAAAPWTLPSHVSLFSGLEAFSHGVNFNDSNVAGVNAPMLAEILREVGYSTRAITGGGFVHPRFGFSRGFDSYRYWPAMRPRSEELQSHLDLATRRVREDRSGAPFFLFLHTFEVHPPNEPRQPYFETFSDYEPGLRVKTSIVRPEKASGFLGQHEGAHVPGESRSAVAVDLPQLATDLYDSAIAYTDTQLERFIRTLEELDLFENTLVVVTSDHGEALGGQDRWGHGHLYENNLMVPLVLFFPGGKYAGTVIDTQVRLLDLFPTLLEAVSVPRSKTSDGRSLLALVAGANEDYPLEAFTYAASTNEGLSVRREDRLKYLFRDAAWPPLNGEEALFDLTRDQDTTQDLASLEPGLSADLRELAVETLRARSRGLRLLLRNSSGKVVKGSLQSPLIHPVKVKSAAETAVPVAWRGMGRLSFDLLQDTEFTLMFVSAPESTVELKAEFEIEGCEEAVELELRLPFEALKSPSSQGVASEAMRMSDTTTARASPATGET
ncbi:MAG: sulfatase, partial [Acidobacteriota bacterium]